MKVSITINDKEAYERLWQLGLKKEAALENINNSGMDLVVLELPDDMWDDVARIKGVVTVSRY